MSHYTKEPAGCFKVGKNYDPVVNIYAWICTLEHHFRPTHIPISWTKYKRFISTKRDAGTTYAQQIMNESILINQACVEHSHQILPKTCHHSGHDMVNKGEMNRHTYTIPYTFSIYSPRNILHCEPRKQCSHCKQIKIQWKNKMSLKNKARKDTSETGKIPCNIHKPLKDLAKSKTKSPNLDYLHRQNWHIQQCYWTWKQFSNMIK